MKNLLLSFLLIPFFSLSEISEAGAEAPPPPPEIHGVEILTPTVEQYGKFEASVDLTADFDNPYDYEEISVTATFSSPGGEMTTVDGFYMVDYSLNTSNGNLSALGTNGFRVRFSPDEIGNWSFTVSVSDSTGMATSDEVTFQCTDISTSSNHGFIRAGQTNYLGFDDGEQYIAIGENIAWQNNNPYLNYTAWLNGLIDNGGNFFRLWHANWGLGVEWTNGNGFAGLGRYRQPNCFYQDWLFDFCAENGLYVMLALQHHGPVSTQVNPQWDDSPYNVANGGPCQSTIEFFTNEEARKYTKNRYRYIVARWGYSRAILCWELFNEVHWTDNFQANKSLVADWHFEMAAYLKSIDPNNHIVTTSYGGDLDDPNVWGHPDIDLTQTHIYLNTPNIERALAHASQSHLQEFGKPTLNGEFGLGGSANLANADPDGIHLHNSLWGGLFSGSLGTAMTWWWDSYIHPRDLYYHFSGISLLVDEVPFLDENLAPANAYVTGAPGDLQLTPSLGWAGIGEAEITIDANGTVMPQGAALGQFLYGSEWNTQFRSPPTFSVSYPADGQFTVRTGDQVATEPKIAIWLDGDLQLEQVATPNTSYSIDVPAGAHEIKVDNTGTDWTTISYYSFEGLGSQVDAYVLVSEEKTMAAGWALNNIYNHENVVENGEPDATPFTEVVVEDFADGSYTVRWFDPLTGALYGGDVTTASGGILNVPLSPFLWDVAFIVDNSAVPTRETVQNLDFEIYPNPASVGAEVSVVLPSANDFSGEIVLLDGTGRLMQTFSGNNSRFRLPENLPTGMYWVVVKDRGKIGTQTIVVSN